MGLLSKNKAIRAKIEEKLQQNAVKRKKLLDTAERINADLAREEANMEARNDLSIITRVFGTDNLIELNKKLEDIERLLLKLSRIDIKLMKKLIHAGRA